MTDHHDAAAETITATVRSWPGVEVGPHRFGGVEFRVGRRELGHLHGNRIADLPFPRRIRNELIAAGRARPHHVLPESGWVTVPIREAQDIDRVVELFRLSYDRAQRARRSPAIPAPGSGSDA
jgi:Luciferase